MPNKKKDKQFFSLAGIDWSDDASIDAGAAAMWGIINAQLSSEMKNENTKVKEPTADTKQVHYTDEELASLNEDDLAAYIDYWQERVDSHRASAALLPTGSTERRNENWDAWNCGKFLSKGLVHLKKTR